MLALIVWNRQSTAHRFWWSFVPNLWFGHEVCCSRQMPGRDALPSEKGEFDLGMQ